MHPGDTAVQYGDWASLEEPRRRPCPTGSFHLWRFPRPGRPPSPSWVRLSTGIYALRTGLPADTLTDDNVVLRYKGLEDVERSFRTLNSELDVRPIRHHLADRVRAHMFLRMLSYYISWHMKQTLAPESLLYDNDKPAAAAKRAGLPLKSWRLPL